MAKRQLLGAGGKKPLLNIPVERLYLDALNPRLPEEYQNKDPESIMYALYRFFDVEELAYSMAENGYFDEEPLVAIPKKLPEQFENKTAYELESNGEYKKFIENDHTEFTVLEGNRRLSTIKILLSTDFQVKHKIRSLPQISDDVKDDISVVPTIIYPNRKEVLPYLGVRHISGIKKWEPYAKARYVASMVEQGFEIEAIQQQVGDRSNSARKIYLCYQLIEQVKNEFDVDTKKAEDNFSYLMLGIGQGPVKDFIGLPKRLQDTDLTNPVPTEKVENLKNLFSWLFGDVKEQKLPVISESRDITQKLSPVLRNSSAITYLLRSRNLSDAYERSDGEEEMLLKNLYKANSSLEKSLPLIARHKSDIVKREIDNIISNIDSIKTLFDKD